VRERIALAVVSAGKLIAVDIAIADYMAELVEQYADWPPGPY